MAAPATTARVAPVGIHLRDGFRTTIAFALDPNVGFWEKTVKPPGVDGGDAIEETTMHNSNWRTKDARQLKTLTDVTVMAAYDPLLYTDIVALINRNGSITIHFPDLSTLDFFGFLQKFEPSELKEGEQPEATITIIPTNFDPAAHVEASPVLTNVAGT